MVLLPASAWTVGCAGSGAAVGRPPPPPPSITVAVMPGSASALLGNTLSFSAVVQNSAITGVTWSVNGLAGGTASTGTITSDGIYTAPRDLPAPATVEIRATSQADAAKFGSAQVTLQSDLRVSVTPPAASVELGAAQAFQGSVASNGHPDPVVHWGITCAAGALNCGAVDANGNYTAPGVLPTPANLTLTAQSAADPSKQANAAITVTSQFTLSVSAPASVVAGSTTTVTATLQAVAGSSPSTGMTWSLAGAGCTGTACGTLTPATIPASTGGATILTATYAAPSSPPNPNTVTITVTPQADPSKKAQATLAILAGSGITISVTPVAATRAVQHQLALSVQVSGTANTGVNWSVNGIAGGNTAVGQICAALSNPCQPVTASAASQVDYLAPGSIPAPNPVAVQAVSQADGSASASAQITVIAHIQVTVLPGSAALASGSVQQFNATVLGTDNQNVLWQVQGAACAGLGTPCGTIDASGLYTAPASAPSPDALQIVAISSEDYTQSGTANVSISTGPNIQRLLPASVYAGGTAGFTLKAQGSGYVPTTPGPGSSLVISGTPRTTTCNSVNECTAPVTPADVAAAGNILIQVQNPGGTMSNQVVLVVVAPASSDAILTLTATSPAVSGEDIVVVEPTTAGVDLPGNNVHLNVAALGSFSVANNSCTLAGNAVALVRPLSGTATAELCVFSASGLDASMVYSVTGPGDISVIAKQPAGLGIIHLTLQISASALPGARTLFIQNANLDKTAATGALEVE